MSTSWKKLIPEKWIPKSLVLTDKKKNRIKMHLVEFKDLTSEKSDHSQVLMSPFSELWIEKRCIRNTQQPRLRSTHPPILPTWDVVLWNGRWTHQKTLTNLVVFVERCSGSYCRSCDAVTARKCSFRSLFNHALARHNQEIVSNLKGHMTVREKIFNVAFNWWQSLLDTRLDSFFCRGG